MYACARIGSTYCQLAGDLLPALETTMEIPGVKDFVAKNIVMYIAICELGLATEAPALQLAWVKDWAEGNFTMCGPGPTATIERSRDAPAATKTGMPQELMRVLQCWRHQVHKFLPDAVRVEGVGAPLTSRKPNP